MKQVLLVCNAHLDIVWLWEWTEGAAEALSTFRTAVEFCEEQDGFVFNHNESVLYEWVEEYDPALFLRIQKLVRKGSWHIMGGWYLQPDCVMISGESFVRQILTGRRYFQQKFHKRPTTALNFDSFGHSVGLVQVLYKAGYDSYIVCRAGRAEEDVKGNDFKWRGLDGTEVVVHYSDENYNTVKGKALSELRTWLEKHKQEENGLFLWGIGNHGGGPSRKDVKDLADYARESGAPILRYSTPEEYFAELKKDRLPVYAKSLGPVSEGCYTSQIHIKQQHRKLENQLYSCEKMLSCAAIQGLISYPAAELSQAQRSLLLSQFHDALPGSSIREVEQASLNQLGHGLEIISCLKAKAFFALSRGQIRAAENEAPILVFNPHPFASKVLVECEVGLPAQNWAPTFMVPTVYQNGCPVPCQQEKESSSFEIDWRKRVIFQAVLPPSSMSRFDCRFNEKAKRPEYSMPQVQGLYHFSGERVTTAINVQTGLLDSLLVDGIPILTSGAFRLALMRDVYNSWGVGFTGFADTTGTFTLMDVADGTQYSGLGQGLTPSVRVVEDGPVRTVVEAVFRHGDSTACLQYKLPKQGLEIELNLRLVWQEKNALLKLCIPTVFSEPTLWGQTAFGRQKLACDGSEQVMHKWCSLSDTQNEISLCIINEGIHGVNCQQGVIGLSLVRGAGYGMSDLGDRIALVPGRMNWRMDQGEHSYRLWLLIGPSNEVLEGLDNRALLHNEEVMALGMCPAGIGELPQPGPAIIGAPSVVLSAFKQEEQGDGFILRLYESQGVSADVSLRLLGGETSLSFSPFEIKTLRYDPHRNTCNEINIMESEV